jgi:hypothetical protein
VLEASIGDAIMRAHEGRAQQMTEPVAIVQKADAILRGTEAAFPHIRHKIEPYGGMLRLTLWVVHQRFDASIERIEEQRPVYGDVPLLDTLQADPSDLTSAARTVLRNARSLVRSRRSRDDGRQLRCEWPGCGAVAAVTTRRLVRVTSPALSRAVVLCELHAASEMAVPEAIAVAV